MVGSATAIFTSAALWDVGSVDHLGGLRYSSEIVEVRIDGSMSIVQLMKVAMNFFPPKLKSRFLF
jgi:hypothetical protein